MAHLMMVFLPFMFVLTISLAPTVVTKRQCSKACRTYISTEIEGKLSRALRVSTNVLVPSSLMALILQRNDFILIRPSFTAFVECRMVN